jgi:hypothetical protein
MEQKEFAESLLVELDKKKNRRVKVPVTWETLEELIRDTLNPKPAEEDPIPFYAPPEIPAEFPKLKVRYGTEIDYKGMPAEKVVALVSAPRDLSAQAWIVVQSAKEEEPFHGSGWLTRPMKDLEKLQSDGVMQYQPPRKKGAA